MFFEAPILKGGPSLPPEDLPILVKRTSFRQHGTPLLRIKSELMPSGDGSHLKHAGADISLADRITEVLERHYPGNFWQIEVDHGKGVAKIRIPVLMAADYWGIIHLRTIFSDPGLRCVVRTGGNLLERYEVPRGMFDLGAWLTAKAKHGRNALLRRKPPE